LPAEVKTMMPYDTYRLFQIERTKCPRETLLADRQAARITSAVSGLLRAIARVPRAARRPYPAAGQHRPAALAEPAACRTPIAG
jgi:hypothetical protein